MIELSFKSAKAQFFDRARVVNALDRATLRVFKEFGRLVRKAAQKSIKQRKGASHPGRPPHGHKSGSVTRVSKSTGRRRIRSVSLLREYIFFAYEPAAKSVVIGPVRLSNTVDPDALPALEYGGSSTIEDREGRRLRIRVAARPFMGPAFEAERPGLPAMWRDSVR